MPYRDRLFTVHSHLSPVAHTPSPPSEFGSALDNVFDFDLRRIQAIQIYPALVRFCFIAIIFSNNLDVSRAVRSGETVDLSFQVLLKLALVGLSLVLGAWGILWRPNMVQVFATVPGTLVLVLLLWHYVTATTAVMPAVALASAFAFTGIVLLTIVHLYTHGARTVFCDVAMGMGLYAMVGIFLSFVSPELTTFQEFISNKESIARFGGLGHPNTLGAYVVLCFVIAFGLSMDGELPWGWSACAFALCVYVLSLAMSRTPVIAGTIAIGLILMPRLSLVTKISVAGIGLMVIWTWLFIDAGFGTDAIRSTLLQSVTKTGQAEELTSATGRTEIWAIALELIAQQPLMGWGSGSTPVVMTGVSGHSHNLILQPTVTLGFPGGALVVVLLLYNLWIGLTSRSAMLGIFVVFLLVLGCVESPILGPFPDGTTLMWLAVTLFVPILQIKSARLGRADIASRL
jgi:exopolysaccharide production protein ExoQ